MKKRVCLHHVDANRQSESLEGKMIQNRRSMYPQLYRKWIDELKAKIIHALGGVTHAEAMIPAPTVQVLHYDVQTVRMVRIMPAIIRTHDAEMEKMLRAEVAHNITEYVMEHDAVVYERWEKENGDLGFSAIFRFLQPHEGEWKV